MKIETAVARMNEPTEWMVGKWFSCQVNFNNPDLEFEDETSFDIDCTNSNWRNELIELWDEFRKENNLPEDCVTDTWSTFVDDGFEI